MLIAFAVAELTVAGACRRAPQPPPADPMIDAIRSEEREGGQFTYAESQGKHLFARVLRDLSWRRGPR